MGRIIDGTGELEEIYIELVKAESEAAKVEIFTAENKETFDWARGYQEGVGKALDLLQGWFNKRKYGHLKDIGEGVKA